MPESCFYVWEADGSPVTVELSLTSVDRLAGAVREAAAIAAAGERRGTETGGFLLGRRTGPATVRVEDFEVVSSEHRRGASFDLSPSDRVRMLRRLEARRSLSVVGYFRSHTRPGMYLDENDNFIARQFFRDPSQVFLLIKPNGQAAPTAGFYYWREGEIDRRQCLAPFPFDRALLLTSGYRVILEKAAVPVSVLTVREIARPPALAWQRWANAAGTFVLTAILAPALVFFGMGAWSKWRTSIGANVGSAVHHKADEETWIPPPATGPIAPEEAPRPSPFRPVKPKPRQLTAETLPPPVRPATQYTPGPARETMAAAIPPPALHPATPEPISKLLRGRPVRPSVSLEPVRGSFLERTVGRIPLIGRLEKSKAKRGEQYVPPRPLKEIAPRVPPSLARELPPDSGVDLRIKVSKSGTVEETQLLSKDSDPVLANLAVHAASHWDFEPARFHDKPVPCEMVAHFHFRPTAE